MKNKIVSGIYNKAVTYRNTATKKTMYKSLIIVKDENGKIVCFDAKENVEICNAISDAIICLQKFGLNNTTLMFNGLEIDINLESDVFNLMIDYLKRFEEKYKSKKDDCSFSL